MTCGEWLTRSSIISGSCGGKTTDSGLKCFEESVSSRLMELVGTRIMRVTIFIRMKAELAIEISWWWSPSLLLPSLKGKHPGFGWILKQLIDPRAPWGRDPSCRGKVEILTNLNSCTDQVKQEPRSLNDERVVFATVPQWQCW
jgi:hypothetical protein